MNEENNLSLSKIKIHPDMSEETNCFSATICLNGKEVGTVKNDGHGGSHMYHWHDREVGKQIEEWSETQETEFEHERLDQIVDVLLSKFEERKQLKRWCKKQTLFRLKGDEQGAWRTIKAPFDSKIKAFLVQKYGETIDRIANEEV